MQRVVRVKSVVVTSYGSTADFIKKKGKEKSG
ncbi:hypothetical protein JOC27_000556 [Sporolactobacillus spathodeae]|uniref:Uncharacterized protein n=1 Tax=Sporolactobacillus spathodeae TaxID=1465502 RepID=A0ABS2Q5S3_9BACL|nr:hypothetical protein [Sporolactobacillus spathodeae]